MKHAEVIAERLVYLGGKPTTKPAPIFIGEDEENAIKLYRGRCNNCENF